MPAGQWGGIETGAVVALTHEGDGIVRAGKAAFVPGALPGEVIRFRRSGGTANMMRRSCSRCSSRRRARVTPQCAHFGICGGCALQHLTPAAQLAAKELELRDNLERVARAAPRTWLAPLAGPAWGYRRRARLSVKYVAKKGRVLVGFRERYKPYVSAISSCEVLAPRAAALIEPLSATPDAIEHPRAGAADRGGGCRQCRGAGAAGAGGARRCGSCRRCANSRPSTACVCICRRAALTPCGV